MFFILPIGHDQRESRMPVVTAGFCLMLLAVFVYSHAQTVRAEGEMMDAMTQIRAVASEYPEAVVHSDTVVSLPESLVTWMDGIGILSAEPTTDHVEGSLVIAESVDALRRVFLEHPSRRLGYVPAEADIISAFTHSLVHADIWHLLGNLFMLWIVGSALETMWAPSRVIAVYALAGLASVLLHHLMDPASVVPVVGASGAISGLMGALMVTMPASRVILAWFLWLIVTFKSGAIQVPAWLVFSLWFVADLFFAVGGNGEGVAHWGHVGGFLAGASIGWVWLKQPVRTSLERPVLRIIGRDDAPSRSSSVFRWPPWSSPESRPVRVMERATTPVLTARPRTVDDENVFSEGFRGPENERFRDPVISDAARIRHAASEDPWAVMVRRRRVVRRRLVPTDA